MDAYSKKFKCVLHFNLFEERVIMYDDMTYSTLLEFVVKRFNLDPNILFNLSFNLPAIERDITNDKDVKFFIDCATNSLYEEIPHFPWVSAIVYLYGQGVIASGCLGDVEKYCKNRKLDLVVGVVKSCTPNSLGDMTVTLKDPTGTMGGTIHYKVFQNEADGYTKSIKVGSVLILRNVSV
ncbi:reverse transcriptase domain-containing protein [Tanacetum coccineum]